MPWPTGHDYQTAVQSLGISFKDPTLKAGKAETNHLGMPKPRSGSYAVAFKIQSGDRDYAVRCFLGEALDRHERYQQVASFLKKAALSYTVEFDYQRDGILVRGKWYPMLKMEWVHGDSLGAYIAKNIGNQRCLAALAARWIEMSRALDIAGMAHGDLQHGNVIIMPDGSIRLIDYDGLYVPAFEGRPSVELGQRNYQHPLRTPMDFGPSLDHFSQWVIYVSIVLVSLDPTLWTRLNGGDECLLFRKADFDNPEASPAFKSLERAKDGRVRSIGEAFRSILYYGASQVPPLDTRCLPPDSLVIDPTLPPGASNVRGGSGWIKDHVLIPATAPTAPATLEPSLAGSSAAWILDYQAPTQPRRFAYSFLFERVTLIVSGILAARGFYYFGWNALVALGLLALGNAAVIAVSYLRQEGVAQARSSRRRVLASRRRVADISGRVERLDRLKAAGAVVLKKALAEVTADRNRLIADESREGEHPKASLKRTSSLLSEERKRLADDDAKELKQLQLGTGSELLEVQRKLAGLDQALLNERNDALVALQRQHVSSVMGRALLAQATIAGIGTGRRATLGAAGIRSAADMQLRGLAGIPGIGRTLQSQLLDWSRTIEAEAMRTRPTALTAETEWGIKGKHSTTRLTLEARRNDLQRRMASEQARIAATHQAKRDSLMQQEAHAQAMLAKELSLIHEKFLPKFAACDGEATSAREDYSSLLQGLGQEYQAVNQELRDMRWQTAKLEHEHAVFRKISLFHFARTAVWPFAR
jgi:hypothetical protein